MPSSPETVATGPAAQRPSTVPVLVRATQQLEQSSSLDGLRRAYGTLAAPLDRWSGSELLRSGLVGHALHPVLTDVPIGTWTSALLLDLFGSLAYDDDLVSRFERGHGGVVETAQRLVADHCYHPFCLDLTRRAADLVLGHGPFPHLETFLAGQQILDDRSEVGTYRGESEQSSDRF